MKENATDALGTAPVGKLLFRMAMPAVAAQIINLLYNLVDRMYIGHIQPIETVGKLDCYMTFKGMKAIYEA